MINTFPRPFQDPRLVNPMLGGHMFYGQSQNANMNISAPLGMGMNFGTGIGTPIYAVDSKC